MKKKLKTVYSRITIFEETGTSRDNSIGVQWYGKGRYDGFCWKPGRKVISVSLLSSQPLPEGKTEVARIELRGAVAFPLGEIP